MLARELELPAMDGDDGDRKVILRHLEAVLDRDVVRASSVVRRELPTPGPELDPGETPESARAPRLVPVAPLLVLPLEQCAGFVPLRGRREGIHDRLRRLLYQPLAAERRREMLGQRREVAGRLPLAGEPVEDRLHGAGAYPKLVVVKPLGQLERSSGVVEPRAESRYPRQATVNERLESRLGGRLA